MGTNNPNILFRLSGVSLGEYVFERNPENLEITPPMQQHTVFKIIEGEDIHQSTFYDSMSRRMTWTQASRTLYEDLREYSDRDANGNIPTSYFWDGTVKEMHGVAVHVLDVHAQPRRNDYDKWDITLTFKPIQKFDKLYRIRKNNQGNPLSSSDVTVTVPDSTYSVNFYDSAFNAVTTGVGVTSYDSGSSTYTFDITSIPQSTRDDVNMVMAVKDGWVVGKTQISGLWGEANYTLV